MSVHNIHVSPRVRPKGIDVDALALVLLPIVNQLPLQRIEELAQIGQQLLDPAERQVKQDGGSAA